MNRIVFLPCRDHFQILMSFISYFVQMFWGLRVTIKSVLREALWEQKFCKSEHYTGTPEADSPHTGNTGFWVKCTNLKSDHYSFYNINYTIWLSAIKWLEILYFTVNSNFLFSYSSWATLTACLPSSLNLLKNPTIDRFVLTLVRLFFSCESSVYKKNTNIT